MFDIFFYFNLFICLKLLWLVCSLPSPRSLQPFIYVCVCVGENVCITNSVFIIPLNWRITVPRVNEREGKKRERGKKSVWHPSDTCELMTHTSLACLVTEDYGWLTTTSEKRGKKIDWSTHTSIASLRMYFIKTPKKKFKHLKIAHSLNCTYVTELFLFHSFIALDFFPSSSLFAIPEESIFKSIIDWVLTVCFNMLRRGRMLVHINNTHTARLKRQELIPPIFLLCEIMDILLCASWNSKILSPYHKNKKVSEGRKLRWKFSIITHVCLRVSLKKFFFYTFYDSPPWMILISHNVNSNKCESSIIHEISLTLSLSYSLTLCSSHSLLLFATIASLGNLI